MPGRPNGVVHVGPEELKNLLPSTTQSIDGMFQDVVELLGTIEHDME